MVTAAGRRAFLRMLFAGAAGLTLTRRVYGQAGAPAIRVTTLTDRVIALTGTAATSAW